MEESSEGKEQGRTSSPGESQFCHFLASGVCPWASDFNLLEACFLIYGLIIITAI